MTMNIPMLPMVPKGETRHPMRNQPGAAEFDLETLLKNHAAVKVSGPPETASEEKPQPDADEEMVSDSGETSPVDLHQSMIPQPLQPLAGLQKESPLAVSNFNPSPMPVLKPAPEAAVKGQTSLLAPTEQLPYKDGRGAVEQIAVKAHAKAAVSHTPAIADALSKMQPVEQISAIQMSGNAPKARAIPVQSVTSVSGQFAQSVTILPSAAPIARAHSRNDPVSLNEVAARLDTGPSKPVMFGSSQEPAKPVMFGSSQEPAKPVMFGSGQEPAKPVMFGSGQEPAKPVMFGNSQEPAKPVGFDSSQEPAKPVRFGSGQEPAKGPSIGDRLTAHTLPHQSSGANVQTAGSEFSALFATPERQVIDAIEDEVSSLGARLKAQAALAAQNPDSGKLPMLSQIKINLNPGSLGAVRIEIAMSASGEVELNLLTAKETTATMIERSREEVLGGLQSRAVEVRGFTVSAVEMGSSTQTGSHQEGSAARFSGHGDGQQARHLPNGRGDGHGNATRPEETATEGETQQQAMRNTGSGIYI